MQVAKEVGFLGHVVSEAGNKADPRKAVYMLSDSTHPHSCGVSLV